MKIISDGKTIGTKVLTDSGEAIKNVQSVNISIDVNEPFVRCTIEILMPQTDIVLKNDNVKEMFIQVCKEEKAKEEVKEEQERVY